MTGINISAVNCPGSCFVTDRWQIRLQLVAKLIGSVIMAPHSCFVESDELALIAWTNDEKFPKRLRLRSQSEFDAVYGNDVFAADQVLVIQASANGRSYSRLGLSVGRKVGNAVQQESLEASDSRGLSFTTCPATGRDRLGRAPSSGSDL